MDPINFTLLLAVPISELNKNTRNIQKLFMNKCIDIDKEHKAILDKVAEPGFDIEKMQQRIDNLITDVEDFRVRMNKLDAKRLKFEQKCLEILQFLRSEPRGPLESYLGDLAQKLEKKPNPHALQSPQDSKPPPDIDKNTPQPDGFICDQRVKALDVALIDALICDYFARNGFFQLAQKLAGSSGLRGVVDIGTHRILHKIVSALKSWDLRPAHIWCGQNKSKLAKLDIELMSELKLVEYVLLLRKGAGAVVNQRGTLNCEALQYIQGNFTDRQFVAKHSNIFSLIAIYPSSSSELKKRATELLNSFELEKKIKSAFYKVYSIPEVAPLEAVLRLGVSIVKTKNCHPQSVYFSPKCCPVCASLQRYPELQSLAKVKFSNSLLFCPLSGEILNENNPPMMTPKGAVCGINSLRRQKNDMDVFLGDCEEDLEKGACKRIFIL